MRVKVRVKVQVEVRVRVRVLLLVQWAHWLVEFVCYCCHHWPLAAE